MTQEGPEATGRLTLWGPGLRELGSVATELGDPRAEDFQEKLTEVNLQPLPASPEAYLAVNLGGLRAPDRMPAVAQPIAPGSKPR